MARLLRWNVVSCLALAMAGLSQPALAQNAPTQSATADEADASPFGDIVVVARKVAEASQSLPISVAAFTSQELTNMVVLNVRDLQTVTPGLTVSSNSQGGAPIFAIRGTSTENLIDGGVALYLNDVALVSSIAMVNQFFDVSAVEILKGPQGTQFGTNTTGGTITVRSNEPTRKLEAFLQAGYGNYNRATVQGMVNLPVNDVLQFRVAGEWIRRDGYINNPIARNSIPTTFGGEDHYALRGSMRLDSGPVNNLLVVDYYKEDNQQVVQVPVAFSPTARGIDLAKLGERLGDRSTVYIGSSVTGNPAYDFPIYVRAKIWGVQDRLTIDVSPNLTVRNVIGYRDDFTDASENYSGTTLIQIATLTQTKTQQWSDDFTLQYKSDDNRMRLNAGFYWQSREREQGIRPLASQANFSTTPGSPTYGRVANIRNLVTFNSNTKAIYANGEFDVTPALTVNGGFRYNWDSSDLRFSSSQGLGLPQVAVEYLPSAAVPCNLNALKGFADKDLSTCFGFRSGKWRAPSWTIGATYHFSPRVLGYAKVSHGYLAGGLNTSIREVPAYNPETKTEYEAGVKADWYVLGRPVRTNLAAFYNKTKNKQVVKNTNYDDGGSANGVFNAASVSAYGLDLETRFSPVERVTLEVNYNYIHTKFDQFLFPAIGGNGDGLTGTTLSPAADLSGNTPAQTPRHQLNLAGTVELPLDESAGKLSTTVSAYYTSAAAQSNVLDPFNRAIGIQYNVNAAYWVANASLNWSNIMGSPVSGQLFVRNLLDEEYTTFRNSQFQAFGYATAIFGMPRTYGFSASVRF